MNDFCSSLYAVGYLDVCAVTGTLTPDDVLYWCPSWIRHGTESFTFMLEIIVKQRKECLLFKDDWPWNRQECRRLRLSLSLCEGFAVSFRRLLCIFQGGGCIPEWALCSHLARWGWWEREVTDILIPGAILTNHTHWVESFQTASECWMSLKHRN